MATVNLSVNVGESKTITFHSGGTYNPEDIVFDVSANGSGYKPIQTAVSSPSASSTATAFIDTISQNTNGVITATKKNLPTASSTVAGITKVGASGGAAAYSHNHTTSIATSTGTNQITLAFGTKYAISAGGTSYVFTMPANPNTDTKVTQTYAAESNYNYWRPLVIGYSSNATEGFTPSTSTDTTYTFSTLTCQPSSGTIRAKSFKIIGGKSSQFLKADGSVDSSSYSLSNHTHSFSSITSRGEAYLEWGGKNLTGTYAPIDASMVGCLGANRTAFVSPDAVTVEYSRDGGKTWKDYDATNLKKIGFFTDFNSSFVIGKSTSSNPANANCQLRVTLSTSSGKVYTMLNKFIIYISTNGSNGCWCSIDARLQSNVKNNTDTWRNFANKVSISGWSGYNVINTSGFTTYGNTPSSQYGQVRFTFGCTGGGSTSYFGMSVFGVNCYGGVGWTAPSEMARNGLLYTYDMSKNATFPANITATKFVKSGGTSSQFLKADGSVDSNTYSTTSHNHSGVYKPVQTAVSSPSASATTSTTFIDTISQNANGVIAATKKTLPTASSTVAGITTVGASGGAAAYSHNHTTSIATSTADSRITLAFGTKYAISAGGTSYVFTMPANPNTNTTYTIATGDSNGQIKVTPSSGNAYNVSVKGLGSAAYTESSAYATSGHTHTGFATSSHTHATSIATSTGTNKITLAFGTKYAITAGGTSYVFTMPANPNTNTTYKFATGDAKGQIKVTPSSGDAYNVSVKGLGSAAYTESSAYATSGHNHSGVYKPVQTAVSDPTASATTSTTFIDSISQDANGVITATKKTLPSYATSGHTHTTSIAKSNEDSRITLAFGTKYVIKAGGTSYVFAMPANPNTNTTYTIATGDSNGQIKVTPSSGNAYNVSVKGLGSAAYTESSAYATSGHTHTGFAASSHTHATSIATSTGTNKITLAFGTKYAITAGGTSYVFTMPANPNTNTTYTIATGDAKGQIKVTPSSGDAYNVSVKGLGSAAYTESSAYATSGHTHSGVYKPVQTAVSSPSASATTSTTFIDTISQNANGVIAATKKTLPTASATVSGITKVGASGGAAAYSHNHTTSIATSTGTNQLTLAFGGKYAITAGGTSYVFTMPANPDTDVKVKQTAHTTTDTTEYPIITTTSASPTSGTAYEAKYATHAAVTGSGDIVLKKSSNKCKLQFDNSLNCLNFIFE